MNALDLTKLKLPVVITGAFGFVGNRAIDILLENGISDIVAFDLPGFVKPTHWNSVKYVTGDISVKSDVDQLMGGAGTVIHLAAMVGDWVPYELHKKVTVEGSRYLYEAAINNNTRVVLSSSIVVYGDNVPKGPCPEGAPWGKPVGAYSTAKQEQETLAWYYARQKGMQLSVIRPANIYGPGSKPWVHDVVETLKLKVPALIDGGDFEASLVHVDNVVQMLLLAATEESALNEAFNGADGSLTTWKQYFSDLSNMLGLPAPKSLPSWLVDPLSVGVEKVWRTFSIKHRPPMTKEALNLVKAKSHFPISKAESLLGFQPTVSYESSLQAIHDYIEREGLA